MLDENKALLDLSIEELEKLALENRTKHFSNNLELCSILNARSGKCSEDCGFCSQSKYFETGIREYSSADKDEIINAALAVKKLNINRFSLVTSGRNLDPQLEKFILPIYKEIKEDIGINLCASHGFITEEQAKLLKEAGVSRYHHNLETGPNYFSKICTTHTYQDRLDTIAAAKSAGLEVCTGGIIGLGESIEDIIEMAEYAKSLEVDSFPLNILTPIKGTAFGENEILTPEYIYKAILIVSIILKNISLRIAGGRTLIPYEYQKKIFANSAAAMMVGNYLTTDGLDLEKDRELIKNSNLISSL